MPIQELVDILARNHAAKCRRERAKKFISHPDIYQLQHGDAPNWIRPSYNSWYHTIQKIGILSGDVSHLDVANASHSCHNQRITDLEVETIRKNIQLPTNPVDIDWYKIKKMFNDPEILWRGRPDNPRSSAKQFKWVSNILNKHTEIPHVVDALFYHIHPYFAQRTPNVAIHVCIILEGLGMEYRWIPCAPHAQTKRRARVMWDRILNDYDEDGLRYKLI